jgi:hypothetical protein
MSLIEVDLDQIKRVAGPAPAGRYDAMVYDLLPQISKSNNPYQRIIFEIIDGQYTDAATTDRGAYIGHRVVCNKPWMFPRLLVATGVIADGQTGKVTVDRESLIEYPVVVDLSVEAPNAYHDKPQNQVEAIFGVEQVPQPLPSISEDLPF